MIQKPGLVLVVFLLGLAAFGLTQASQGAGGFIVIGTVLFGVIPSAVMAMMIVGSLQKEEWEDDETSHSR